MSGLAVVVAVLAGAIIEAWRVAHAVRTRRAALEARLAGGASAREAVHGVVGRPWRSAAAGAALGVAASAGLAATLLAAIAGGVGGRIGFRYATRRLFDLEFPPDEAATNTAFRNAPPVKTYDPDHRPRVFDDRDRSGSGT